MSLCMRDCQGFPASNIKLTADANREAKAGFTMMREVPLIVSTTSRNSSTWEPPRTRR